MQNDIDLSRVTFHPDSLDRLFAQMHKDRAYLRFAKPLDYKQTFARQVERRLIDRLASFGYPVNPTAPNAFFDCWVAGARVEIKASRWINQAHKGRYQAAIRNHQADVLILDAVNGTDHYFIIPMDQIYPRRTVEITRYDVTAYAGRWAEFLENWDWLHRVVETAGTMPIQLNFFNRLVDDFGGYKDVTIREDYPGSHRLGLRVQD